MMRDSLAKSTNMTRNVSIFFVSMLVLLSAGSIVLGYRTGNWSYLMIMATLTVLMAASHFMPREINGGTKNAWQITCFMIEFAVAALALVCVVLFGCHYAKPAATPEVLAALIMSGYALINSATKWAAHFDELNSYSQH